MRGGALIVPSGLLRRLLAAPEGGETATPAEAEREKIARQRVEELAMAKVMATEKALGREPRNVSAERGIGYDVESLDPATGALYFIEVKGVAASDQVTLTRSEVFCARNEPRRFRLAVVRVEDDRALEPVYLVGYDFGQPGFAQTTSTYSLSALLAAGGAPC
ncbi:MAG: DUF3883 domain-containing protein [Alphaproteobacteria bacterium]|nr:MAG: DUF3883 domain-containing protein [Alphaproteobacteria bacterium]